MAVDLEKHSEPTPAVEEVAVRTHPIVAEFKKPDAPDVNAILDQVDDAVHDVCAKYDGRVFDGNQVEKLKAELHEVPHVRSVGVSMLEEAAEVVVQVMVAKLESWIKATVPAKLFNDAVVADKELEDNGGRVSRRGGKAASGINATAPYAEPPANQG